MMRQKLVIGTMFVFLVGVVSVAMWRFSLGSTPTIRIRAEEFRFSPKKTEVIALQEVRFVISNYGGERHTFYASFLDNDAVHLEWESPDLSRSQGTPVHLSRGQSVSFLATFPAGIYPFRCVIQGHRGMEGVVVVRRGREGETAK
ncbi:hypothetical protein [Nitrospira sp. M1]